MNLITDESDGGENGSVCMETIALLVLNPRIKTCTGQPQGSIRGVCCCGTFYGVAAGYQERAKKEWVKHASFISQIHLLAKSLHHSQD